MDLSAQISFFGKLAGKYILKVAAYTAVGIALNIVLLVIKFGSVTAVFSTRAADVFDYAILSGLVSLPVFFFFVGHKQAIQSSLSSLLKQKKLELLTWLLTMLGQRHPEVFDETLIDDDIRTTVNNVTEYVDKIPPRIIKLLTRFVSAIGLAEKLISLVKTAKFSGLTIEDKVTRIADELCRMIPDDLFKPGMLFPITLLAVNLSLFFL